MRQALNIWPYGISALFICIPGDYVHPTGPYRGGMQSTTTQLTTRHDLYTLPVEKRPLLAHIINGTPAVQHGVACVDAERKCHRGNVKHIRLPRVLCPAHKQQATSTVKALAKLSTAVQLYGTKAMPQPTM